MSSIRSLLFLPYNWHVLITRKPNHTKLKHSTLKIYRKGFRAHSPINYIFTTLMAHVPAQARRAPLESAEKSHTRRGPNVCKTTRS